MTREIKFRAWDEDHFVFMNDSTDEYCWTVCEDGFKIEYFDADQCKISGGELCEFGGWVECPNAIFEQFTGLLDKNGKEIYEGDIVTYKRHMGFKRSGATFASIYEEYNCTCEWKSASFGFYPINSKCPFVMHRETNMEVIGNIHENQELLKNGE